MTRLINTSRVLPSFIIARNDIRLKYHVKCYIFKEINNKLRERFEVRVKSRVKELLLALDIT